MTRRHTNYITTKYSQMDLSELEQAHNPYVDKFEALHEATKHWMMMIEKVEGQNDPASRKRMLMYEHQLELIEETRNTLEELVDEYYKKCEGGCS